MGYKYSSRNMTPQQKVMARNRDKVGELLKQDSEKRLSTSRYEFNYDNVKEEISKEEFGYLVDEIERYEQTIIDSLLNEEKRGSKTLYSAIAIKDIPEGERIRVLSKGFKFLRDENVVRVYTVN